MQVVWVALIVFGFCLILALVIIFRFPDEIKAMLRRTKSFQVTPTKVAWDLFEEAILVKEHHRPSRDRIEPMLQKIDGGRVLWVDDTPDNNRLEVGALEALGVEIELATSNAEALDHLGEEEFDLILSDIGRHPPEDPEAGLELPRQLRERQIGVEIAFYTGEATAPTTPSGERVFDTPTDLLGYLADYLSQRNGGRDS